MVAACGKCVCQPVYGFEILKIEHKDKVKKAAISRLKILKQDLSEFLKNFA